MDIEGAQSEARMPIRVKLTEEAVILTGAASSSASQPYAKIVYVIEYKCLLLKDQGLVWVLLYSLGNGVAE